MRVWVRVRGYRQLGDDRHLAGVCLEELRALEGGEGTHGLTREGGCLSSRKVEAAARLRPRAAPLHLEIALGAHHTRVERDACDAAPG